jgi:two-component system, OmpR family, copper resistance phosphate regulon response regulator CusR
MATGGYYDLVILDLLMPGQDGFSALREIMRRRPHQSVLVLSCLSDPESKMASLGLGADDYLPKPFHVGELVARVQARLRAAARPGAASLTCGRLTLDVLRRQADAGSGPVPLTSREFQLLWELMHEPGAVVSKDALLARVWGETASSVSNVVDAYIRRLRARLGPDVIVTVRGEGYCVGSR